MSTASTVFEVMGVVNVTPDSFSDGGRWFGPAAAIAHGLELAAGGADIVDVGGESTRPGALRISEDEWTMFVQHAVASLEELRVAEKEKNEFLRALVSSWLS